MNTLKNTLLAATLIAGTFAMGSASALTLNSIPGVTGANLQVQVVDGVATIFGNVDSGIERHLARAYVEKLDNVEKVINLVTFN